MRPRSLASDVHRRYVLRPRSNSEVTFKFGGRAHVLRPCSNSVDGRWREFSFVTCYQPNDFRVLVSHPAKPLVYFRVLPTRGKARDVSL
jgi:hypothetical protein